MPTGASEADGPMADSYAMSDRAKWATGDEAATDDAPVALVARARRGDAAAFGALVRQHQDAIYRLAWRMVGPDEAEDVAQGAFLRAWDALPNFAGDAAFGTWLYRIALNGCYDHLRRRTRLREVPLDETTLAIPAALDVAATVVAADEDAARRAALVAALAALSPDDRALLALRVGEGWSYDRIAATLGVASKTVGTRLFRVRARLHRLIVAAGGEGRDEA